MDLVVAHGARLELRGLIVKARRSGCATQTGLGVTLQAEEVHIAEPQEVRVRGAVRRMARLASFRLHRIVLEDKGALLVHMALETHRVLRGRRAQLFRPEGPVGIMTIAAADQPFIHSMVERHIELRLRLQVAVVAEPGLPAQQQGAFCLRVMRRVAIETPDVVLRVNRMLEIHLLLARLMAFHAARRSFLRRCRFEMEDRCGITGILYVSRPRSVARFAPLFLMTDSRV